MVQHCRRCNRTTNFDNLYCSLCKKKFSCIICGQVVKNKKQKKCPSCIKTVKSRLYYLQPWRQELIAKYIERVEQGLDLWTGEKRYGYSQNSVKETT